MRHQKEINADNLLDRLYDNSLVWFSKDANHSASLEMNQMNGFEIFTIRFYGKSASTRKQNFVNYTEATDYLISNHYELKAEIKRMAI